MQKLEQLLPDAYGVLAANPDCAAVQDQLQPFRVAKQRALVDGGLGEAEMF
jgi:hypothetical protein